MASRHDRFRDEFTGNPLTANISEVDELVYGQLGQIDARRKEITAPENALISIGAGEWQYKGATLGRKGLTIPDSLTNEDWLELGDRLFSFEERTALWLGDWLVSGEDKRGVTYNQIAAKWGKNEKTLRNYVWVCRAVPMSLRRDNLTFGHYALVSSKKIKEVDKRKLINAASMGNWSVSQLGAAIENLKPRPALSSGTWAFDDENVPKISRKHFQLLATKAGQGNQDARRQLDEEISQIRNWLDEVQRIARGDP